MYRAYTGDKGEHYRAYAREQFRGNVGHINRDERVGEKQKGARKRDSEKNGERYVRTGELEGGKLYDVKGKEVGEEGGEEKERESNSRYNFDAPRKLKLLRAEHAELSAVFLLGTIRIAHPFLHFLCFHPRVCPRYAAPSSSSSFSRETAPFNIVGGNASGKSRSHGAATFGVKCVHDALPYNSNFTPWIRERAGTKCKSEITRPTIVWQFFFKAFYETHNAFHINVKKTYHMKVAR